MRDPDALHKGMRVTTPRGPGIIRHRVNGPLERWMVNDWPWPAKDLVPIETPPPRPLISPLCHHERHEYQTSGCGGGFLRGDRAVGCACRCHDDGGDSDKGAGQAYNRGNRTAPEDACDVNEGLTTLRPVRGQ